MRSNRLSSFLGFTTFGESHSPALGIVIEDVKPGIEFPFEELNKLLALRKPNADPYSTTRLETDEYQIISGIFEGKTTGMPICLLFWNKDAKPEDYEYLKDIIRPGHADYSLFRKFKIFDYRGGGRASGRETISRIAASVFADKLINPIQIKFQTIQIGTLLCEKSDEFYAINQENSFCWAEKAALPRLCQYLDAIKADNNTVGGIIRVMIDKVPAGLGDPVYEKLNACLAKAIMSIGSIKGVAFGDGFELANQTGSQANDQMNRNGFLSNQAGGIAGGISTGQPIIINIAVKPVSSHGQIQQTITKTGEETTVTIKGRHDICHIPRLLPVIEAMIKLTLADAIAWQKQIAGEELELDDYRETINKIDEELLLLLYRRKMIVGSVKKYKQKNQLEFRDIAREKALSERWISLAEELDIDKAKVSIILDKVLEICRIDSPDCSV
jgi:chorismate synthase